MEGAATTVYANGGRGNARLAAWEGERTVTWTMEDALISPEGFMILSGAGLVEATDSKPIFQHIMETTDDVIVVNATNAADFEGMDVADGDVIIRVANAPYLPIDQNDNYAYVMITENGAPISEPIIPLHTGDDAQEADADGKYALIIKKENIDAYWIDICENGYSHSETFTSGTPVLVDYYVKRHSGAKQINITADKFGGNYYLEASTLFRDAATGQDYPAEFIIPNCKVQSSFNFTMASTGDPSERLMRMAA